jgi:hypothetical protein
MHAKTKIAATREAFRLLIKIVAPCLNKHRASWGTPGLAAFIAGCTVANQNMAWVRGDGQAMRGDAVLMRQFDADRAICFGERKKAAADGIIRSCMAQRGYLLVPRNEAAARSAELARIAAEKARRDAFAAKKNNSQGE